ncbi:Phage integrase, N-terminal SAM-like domain [Actinobaculum suis]|uniref:Phage integrase, N-terminal SAM-like domain n=1 Tax=Actinobaculum suis TaxID=1657 RepID=A0A1G7ADW2_9ACTO|nr:site-specific integrase [Actinobaculum suis]MDY5152592.1 tyrosine-type recombinase/integrase [Actinobaculum suis]SDE12989.1 Phage integrase, N-terminal SAM-like domain [Actinobaculum suis]
MARRRGFGYIEKRGKALWRAEFLNPHQKYKKDGARNIVRKSFTTKATAEAWLAKQKHAIDKGTWKSPETKAREREAAEHKAKQDAYTLGEYARGWIDTVDVTPATRRGYESVLRCHILPRWADVPLKEIRRPEVVDWANSLTSSVKSTRDTFRNILNAAVADERISENPYPPNSKNVRKPVREKGRKKRQAHAISREELLALANEVPEYQRLMTLTAGQFGLRSGEIRELRGKDVAYDSTTGLTRVRVERGVTGDGVATVVGNPKTRFSIRTIYMGGPVGKEIAQRARQVGPAGLLFPAKEDARKHMPNKQWGVNLANACKRLGIEHTTPHDLRHTATSLAIRAGMHLRDVQAMLGHSTDYMTKHYSHSLDEFQQDGARKIAAYYSAPRGVASLDTRRAKRA